MLTQAWFKGLSKTITTNRSVKTLHRALTKRIAKNWHEIYLAVDLHDTVYEPTYCLNSLKTSSKHYPYSFETLELLTMDPHVNLVLWTCSKPEDIVYYLGDMAKHRIKFNQVGHNLKVVSTDYADFNHKDYFDAIFDDKAGFEVEDWIYLNEYCLERRRRDYFIDDY